jgi:hypothetical protein
MAQSRRVIGIRVSSTGMPSRDFSIVHDSLIVLRLLGGDAARQLLEQQRKYDEPHAFVYPRPYQRS